jgi:hypothetical protein
MASMPCARPNGCLRPVIVEFMQLLFMVQRQQALHTQSIMMVW